MYDIRKSEIDRAEAQQSKMPQISFALSRGFAKSGRISVKFTQGGALPVSRLPWAIIGRPCRASICGFAGRRDVWEQFEEIAKQ
jgi:hypothetical protein